MNNYEILIVDDAQSSAKIYSELIERKTLLKTTFATNSAEAILIIQENNIKVVILDQRMPEKSGTELYKEIKYIAPDVKTIMFSGEADHQEITDAWTSLNYEYYLHKSDIKKLPEKVLEMYAKYELDILNKQNNRTLKLGLLKRLYCIIRKRKDQSIVSHRKISSNFIFPDSWKEIENINEGEEKEIKIELSHESKFVVLKEISLSSAYFYKDLLNKLSIKLKGNLSQKKESTNKRKIEKKTNLKFDTQDRNFESAQIISKSYEMAYVYDEYRILILEKCPLCNVRKVNPINAFKQNNKYATRIIYHYNDGEKEIIDTGIHKV